MVWVAVLLAIALLLPTSCGKLTVHINMHTHDDVGWLKTVDQYYVGLNKTIDSSVVQYILTTVRHHHTLTLSRPHPPWLLWSSADHSSLCLSLCQVVDELLKDPKRKFMYVEQAFFQRFWQQQSDARKVDIRKLVASKQLEFVNGGWCMHDEATTHWVDMVDQTTLGHRFISDEFGYDANPTIGWQIDPFGHSATQASLLTAQAGLQAFFTARIDYQDFQQRVATNSTEWIWRASPSLPGATVFAGVFQWANTALYGPWPSFNYELYSTDPPIQDDPALTDFNVQERVDQFVEFAHQQAQRNRGENLLFNAGFDFNSESSHECTPAHHTHTQPDHDAQFTLSQALACTVRSPLAHHVPCVCCRAAGYKNLDKLIAAVNSDGRVLARYSTPSDYVAAKHNESLTWPLKTDDLFPYASREHECTLQHLTPHPFAGLPHPSVC